MRLVILIVIVVVLIVLIVLILVNAAFRKRILKHSRKLPQKADIVIIGVGVAGCVLARRLWERYPNKRIVMLDRGEDRRNDPNVYRSEAALTIAYSAPYSEVIQSDFPGVGCSVASMVGGGSSHNFGIVVKGSRHFLETEWNPVFDMSNHELKRIHRRIDSRMDITPLPVKLDIASRILPAASKLFRDGAGEVLHGINVIQNLGPLRANNEISEWILCAMTSGKYKLEVVRDYNNGVGPCACPTPQLFVDKILGVRASVNRAYLPERSSLKVIEYAEVNVIKHCNDSYRIKLKDKRVIKAKKVIMAAGAIYTPFILKKSHIGDHLPIGENLKSHYGCTMVLAVKGMKDFSSGPLAFVSTNNDHVRNWQIITSGSTLTNLAFLNAQGIDTQSLIFDGYKFITFLAWDLRPKTNGSIGINCANKNQPTIALNLFESSCDKISIVNALRFLGDIFKRMKCSHKQEKCKEEKVKLLFPVKGVFKRDDFDELLANAKTGISLTDHYCGTCKYGTVLESDFSVKGHPNLHVVDASTFPSIIDGNTEYGTLTVAELAATRITCK